MALYQKREHSSFVDSLQIRLPMALSTLVLLVSCSDPAPAPVAPIAPGTRSGPAPSEPPPPPPPTAPFAGSCNTMGFSQSCIDYFGNQAMPLEDIAALCGDDWSTEPCPEEGRVYACRTTGFLGTSHHYGYANSNVLDGRAHCEQLTEGIPRQHSFFELLVPANAGLVKP